MDVAAAKERQGKIIAGKVDIMETKKWYQKMPHVCILLLFIIIICAVLTYIIPAGEFDREQIEGTSRAVVVAGSYHPVEQAPVSFMTTFKSLTK